MSNLALEILKYLNRFRDNPRTVEKECQLFQILLSRLRPNDPFLKEMEAFMEEIGTISKMQRLTLNKSLTKYAEQELERYVKDPGSYPPVRKGAECYGLISDSYLAENPGIIYDFGAESPNYVCPRILIKREDKSKAGREIITNPEYSQVGIAAEVNGDGDHFVVLIFANKYTDDVTILEEDLMELKKAFDLLDYHNEGRVRINDAIDSMKELKMNETDPAIFEMMSELAGTTPYISWPKFADKFSKRLTDRKTDKGLKDMFEVFVDNIKKDKIDMTVLTNICKLNGIEKSEEELIKLVYDSTKSTGEISFEDFCKVMKVQ